MATPLATLLNGLRTDEIVRARFERAPLDFMDDHGWTALEPGDLQEAMLILADGAPGPEAVTWIEAGRVAGDHTTAADALAAAVSSLAAGQVDADPASLDAADDDDSDRGDTDDSDTDESDDRDDSNSNSDSDSESDGDDSDSDDGDSGEGRRVGDAPGDELAGGPDLGDDRGAGGDPDFDDVLPENDLIHEVPDDAGGAFADQLPDLDLDRPDPGEIGDGWDELI